MKKINVTSVCNSVAASNKAEKKDWGFSFTVKEEIDALRIAYAYRNSPFGLKVEHCPSIDSYMVTVWNDKAKALGIDTY